MSEKKRPGRATRYPGVTDLGDGRYRLRVYRTLESGKQRELERMVVAASVEEAVRLRMKLESETARPARDSAKRSALGAAITEWLRAKVEAKRKGGEPRLCPGTIDRYQRSVRDHIVPYLEDRDPARLSRADVEAWRDHLGGHYASATVNGHLRVLREFLSDVGNQEAARARALQEDDGRLSDDEPNMLVGDEIERFLAAARKLEPGHYPLLLVLLTTSMRISTALALRREDFDPRSGIVVARRRRSMATVVEGVKRGRRSRDTAPLLPEVWAEVQRHLASFSEVQVASGLAFPSRTGGHHARSVLNNPLRRILKEASIAKRFTAHGFRRTAANEYRREVGGEMAKRIAGHMTDRMHEHYTSLGADETRGAGEAAFGSRLRVVGGRETGDRTGDRGEETKKG